MKKISGESYGRVCAEMEVPLRSVMRWRHHYLRGEPLAERPGPTKVGSFHLDTLLTRIRNLEHGRERTRGTGALYAEYSCELSRRDFLALVERVREEIREEEKAKERHIEWKDPGRVWAMDDADVNPVEKAEHGHMNVVHDLGSQYTLRVLGSEDLADGQKVAGNLEELFEEYGAPLFLKMDNGSNLNHHAVLSVLDKYGVIPLNSPAHYPPYNGAIEHKQGEIKQQLVHWIGHDRVSERELKLAAGLSGHELNHKRRRSLQGRTSCCTFQNSLPLTRRYDRRDRKEVLEEITLLAIDIVERLEEHTVRAAETAYRYAVETWLQQNNIINVIRNKEVLPPFYRF